MSDAQSPAPDSDFTTEPDFTTDVDGNPIPSDEVLAEQALPAIYTRSPRLVQVVATTAAIGAGAGFIIGVALPAGFMSSRFAAGMVVALAGALAGALIAGIVVAGGERREARRVAQRKMSAIEEWLGDHPNDAAADPGELAP